MLEVKHLKKSYKTKKGAVTKALDDVSLNFPETGMVFILGKSGSGKSTLLNVCGGLDRMDEGEIIIKGKSSKDFTGQDFDSYRNTYVGFVFQEYNILDEFTVAQNIALALELQNKKPDKAVVDQILADVDLTDFASRKPNTLSGGQKQRVAIARALVKEPEIIMAAEPTGALDSKTGQQVFDTLKKLSKSKLVLVVSHDRDFAEQYGDRIIELKDGQIISDQTRAESEGEQNVTFYGTDTVCVAKGAEISDEDLQKIKTFLNRSGGTAVISTSREKIAQFREDRPEISVGTFENIKEQPVPKEYEPQKLIRSHLPIKHAVKMGAGSLKTKPVRLAFTILLSVIAFVLFGLASTLMLFNGQEVRVQSFVDAKPNYLSLGKVYYLTYHYSDGDTYTSDRDTSFTQEEYEALAEQYPGAIPMVSYGMEIANFSVDGSQRFYDDSLNNFVLANDNLQILAGRLPQADDEIAITDFVYDAIKTNKSTFIYGKDKEKLEPTSYEDVLWSKEKPIVFEEKYGDKKYKVVGVFKGMEVPADFQEMKRVADGQSDSKADSQRWYDECRSGMYMTAAVNKDLFFKLGRQNGGADYYTYFKYSADSASIRASISATPSEDEQQYGNQFSQFALYQGRKLNLYDFAGNLQTALANNGVAVSGNRLLSFFNDLLYQVESEIRQEEDDLWPYRSEAAEAWRQQHPYDGHEAEYDNDWWVYDRMCEAYVDESEVVNSHRSEMNKTYRAIKASLKEFAEEQFISEHPTPQESDYTDHSEYEMEYERWERWKKERIEGYTPAEYARSIADNYRFYLSAQIRAEIKKISGWFTELGVTPHFTISNETTAAQPISITSYFVGNASDSCYLGETLYEHYANEQQGYYSSTQTTKYVDKEDAYISNVLIPYDGSRAAIEAMLAKSGVAEEDDSAIAIESSMLKQLDMIVGMADTLKMAFTIAGIVLAAFAFLLMFNFISASITAKKKDIGILRAIGARTTDVFKIFISEALIIALICFAVSVIGTFGLCMLLNNVLLEDVGLSIKLFIFGPLSVLIVLGVALVTALVSTIIPVSMYSRKPPIASIRAL